VQTLARTQRDPGAHVARSLIVKYDGSANQLWVVKHDGADKLAP
jgi:hypothetical protein